MVLDEAQFSRVLNLLYRLSIAVKDTEKDPQRAEIHSLIAKIFFHAASLVELRKGTRISLKSLVQETNFFDFASTAVIARSVFETYLTLHEVFVAPVSDDAFRFEYALWKLSGIVLRENYVPSDPAFADDIAKAQQELVDVRTALSSTATFTALTPKQQAEAMKGKRIRQWTEVAQQVGFNETKLRKLYGYFSSYVHADGLSASQVVSAGTAQEQIDHIDFHMRVVLICMSQLVLQLVDKYPEAMEVAASEPEATQVAKLWAGVWQ